VDPPLAWHQEKVVQFPDVPPFTFVDVSNSVLVESFSH
jgi:hypothetical protein